MNFHFSIGLVSKTDKFANVTTIVKGLFEKFNKNVKCELIKLEEIEKYKVYFDKMDALIYLDDYTCELTKMYGDNILAIVNNKNITISRENFDYSLESIHSTINEVFRYVTGLYDFYNEENKKISNIVKSCLLTENRYNHVLSVNKLSKEIVEKNNIECNKDKLEMICLLHDITKEMDISLDTDIPKPLWHAITGATYISDNLNIEDTDILNAVKYHTTGYGNMNIYDEVLILSDFCEPLKKGDYLKEVRELMFTNYKKALAIKFSNQIEMFKDNPNKDTIDAYNKYKEFL